MTMFRSAQAALAVILICFGIMQIPGQPQYAPLPSSMATQPEAILPVPDSDELWSAIRELEGRVTELEKRPLCPPVSMIDPAKSPAPVVVTRPTDAVQSSDVAVTMHTIAGCAPCAVFIRDELPKLADLNIRIVEGGANSYPTFVLVSDRKTITLGGRLSAAGLRYRIRELLSR